MNLGEDMAEFSTRGLLLVMNDFMLRAVAADDEAAELLCRERALLFSMSYDCSALAERVCSASKSSSD